LGSVARQIALGGSTLSVFPLAPPVLSEPSERLGAAQVLRQGGGSGVSGYSEQSMLSQQALLRAPTLSRATNRLKRTRRFLCPSDTRN